MRRLVFISLEFSAGTFSGNGVYARSQASRPLARAVFAVSPDLVSEDYIQLTC